MYSIVERNGIYAKQFYHQIEDFCSEAAVTISLRASGTNDEPEELLRTKSEIQKNCSAAVRPRLFHPCSRSFFFKGSA